MENAFPHFADGDVQIILTSTHRYKLHANTLRRASPFFDELLNEHFAKKPTKRGATVRFRLMLIETDNAAHAYCTGGSDTPYTLHLMQEGDIGEPIVDPHAEHFGSAWIQVSNILTPHILHEH